MVLSCGRWYMSLDKSLLSQNLSHHTATFILTYERIFSIIGLSEIIQYLSACNIANYLVVK